MTDRYRKVRRALRKRDALIKNARNREERRALLRDSGLLDMVKRAKRAVLAR